MLRTLYAKLALVLFLLLALVGGLYAFLSTAAMRQHVETVTQQFNRDLARNLVADRNLVAEGRLDQAAIMEMFRDYMIINPSIEIYLLDPEGAILSYSAEPGEVKRRRVSLEPVQAFLRGDRPFPLLGDDPRGHDRQKAFSVTPVPSAENPEGYLYVVLRGEEFDAVDKMARDSYLLRLSAGAVVVSLAFGLLIGLWVFRVLTRRLHRLAAIMEAFDRSEFTARLSYGGREQGGDEVDRLGGTFDRMAERIVAQIDRLREKDALRRELVAHVSHDLRTPLASLRGYLESLQMKASELSEAERAEYVAIALRHSEHLSRLVAELFELAALDARETLPRCEPFSPGDLVQDVAQKFQLEASQGGVRLTFEPAAGVPFVSADIAMTERVLENLIENALLHTRAGGEVRVAFARDDAGVVFRVADNGRGIAPADVSRVFDPFYKAAGKADGGEHAGLGLAIARRIVELHGGDIWVTSSPEEGTVFSFTLPT